MRKEASMGTLRLLVLFGVSLVPSTLQAQSVAHSFDELRHSARVGQTVVVTDVNGGSVRGTLTELSGAELVLLTPERHVLTQQDVARVRRTDSVWNGVAIGAGVGVGVAILGGVATKGSDSTYTWGYILSWALPAGGAVGGWLVDRSLMKTLYAAEPSSAKVSVSPLLASGALGALLSIRY
jgi:hypothetical protein